MTHLHPHRSDDDQIFQKYLDRAIADINQLEAAISACDLCAHKEGFTPVVGTGHPLADIFMLKHHPRSAELDEGVAFFGAAGEAVLASVQRLNLDPLDLYGTNCVKCSAAPSPCEREHCPGWLRTEFSIVEPKILIVMGEEALETVNALGIEDARMLRTERGVIQSWTHTCQALLCPDIDDSLSATNSKASFWNAFRAVGDWYAERPPF